MSAEQLDALADATRNDTQLTERLSAATTVEDAIAVATDAGFNVTAEDLAPHVATGRGELTEQELSRAAGGTIQTITICYFPTAFPLCRS